MSRKTLFKKLDNLVSEIVKQRDGQCLICGNSYGLDAHHFIMTKGASTKHRWNLKNLITLCRECHRQAHDIVSFKNAVKRSAVENNICTEKELNEIQSDLSVAKFSISDLQEMIAGLRKFISEAKNA